MNWIRLVAGLVSQVEAWLTLLCVPVRCSAVVSCQLPFGRVVVVADLERNPVVITFAIWVVVGPATHAFSVQFLLTA